MAVETPPGELGTFMPTFSLLATDGRKLGTSDFKGAKASLVMFICNHCPYVVAVEDRLIALGRELSDEPIKIMAISSNDTVKYPADSFENMKARALTKAYPFAYLFDESQEVAKAFGAVCTPDFFLFDEKLQLRYRGRLDDSWKDPSKVQKRELLAAIRSLIDDKDVPSDQRSSMGCSIKWKPEMVAQ